MIEKIQSIASPKQTKEGLQYEQNDRESNNEERNMLNDQVETSYGKDDDNTK